MAASSRSGSGTSTADRQKGGKVGRPRRDPRPLRRPPEEEILHQAARLFATKRFEATSTREIAEASGLRPSSLFHYFPTKEDILVALSEQANVKPLANLERISEGAGSPAVKLFRVVEAHMHVASADRGAWRAVLENSHSLSRRRFRRYLELENRYSGGIRDLIAQGVRTEEFVDEPTGLAAARILGMCNWSLRFARKSGPVPASEMARLFARSAVRSLLVDSRQLGVIEREAAALDARDTDA